MKKQMIRSMIPAVIAAAAMMLSACAATANAAEGSVTEAAAESSAAEAPADTKTHSDADARSASDILTTAKTAQYFTDEEVPKEDIQTILEAGINTTSAMNGQPWHFTAVTNQELLQQIADEMSANMPQGAKPAPSSGTEKKTAKAGIGDAPLVIVVSCAEGSELDAGLATQSIFIEAELLGYGAKIVSSPTMVLNGENKASYREALGIPEEMSFAAAVLIGKEDTETAQSSDAATGASARNPFDDMVTFVE